jgi:DNA gyrase subunit A
MLVTNAGRLIRVPADQVRLTGRPAMGVTLFRLDAGERVTSLFPVLDDGDDDAPEPPASADEPPGNGQGDAPDV